MCSGIRALSTSGTCRWAPSHNRSPQGQIPRGSPQNRNRGELTKSQLIEQTVRLGFTNVIDAFHVVGRAEIPQRFFLDERVSGGGIRVTEAFSELLNGDQASNLPLKTDARWRLVETAWELGASPALLAVSPTLTTGGVDCR